MAIGVSLAFASALYLAGAARSRIRGRAWPAWRTALFLAGLLAIGAALLSPIDALAHDLFSVHMVQHMLLVAVGAPLLLLGAPVRPLLRGIPRAIRRAVVRPIARSGLVRGLVHLLRHPLVAGALYVGGLYAWHVPALYDAALADEIVHVVEHLWFIAAALLFWSVVIDPEPFRATLPYAARIVFLLLAGAGQNTILGGLLAFSTRLLYRSYEGRPERYGFDAVTDQRVGGAIMWVPGDVIFLGAASAAFFLWLAQEEREQRRREARG